METYNYLDEIRPRDYEWQRLSQDAVLKWFDLNNAVWVHDGDPAKPHAELTSGLCSNGYFDCPRVLCHPRLNEILARQLVHLLRKRGLGSRKVNWVIGSAYAAITFSYEVAKILSATHGFTEKDYSDPAGKKMLWRRMKIPAGSFVLQIEELITTSATFREVRRAIIEGNGEPVNFLPIVGALVHRPPKLLAAYDEIQIVALIEKEVWAVKMENCPLCKAGSAKYQPKSHWAELTGKK